MSPKLFLILSALVPLLAGCGQPPGPRLSSKTEFPVFPSAKYPPDRYKTTQAEYMHGKARIRIAHAKRVANVSHLNGESDFHYCRAWLSVTVDSKVVFERVFPDIDPNGYVYGLFVPKSQPPGSYFVVVKQGDYDGRLILIDKNGSVQDRPGGSYFITDAGLLFSVQASPDGSGFFVFDLEKGDTVFETTHMPPVHQWYRIGGTIGFTKSEWLEQNRGTATERRGEWHIWNSSAKRIVRQALPDGWRSTATRIDYDVPFRDAADCECATSR